MGEDTLYRLYKKIEKWHFLPSLICYHRKCCKVLKSCDNDKANDLIGKIAGNFNKNAFPSLFENDLGIPVVPSVSNPINPTKPIVYLKPLSVLKDKAWVEIRKILWQFMIIPIFMVISVVCIIFYKVVNIIIRFFAN